MKRLGLMVLTGIIRLAVIVLVLGGALCAGENLVDNTGAGVLGLLAMGLGVLLFRGDVALDAMMKGGKR